MRLVGYGHGSNVTDVALAAFGIVRPECAPHATSGAPGIVKGNVALIRIDIPALGHFGADGPNVLKTGETFHHEALLLH